jgi:hypothetical protein
MCGCQAPRHDSDFDFNFGKNEKSEPIVGHKIMDI